MGKLVDALRSAQPGTQILDHIARAPQAPDINGVVDQLRRVLESALGPLEDRIPSRDLLTAAEIIEAATDAMVAEGS